MGKRDAGSTATKQLLQSMRTAVIYETWIAPTREMPQGLHEIRTSSGPCSPVAWAENKVDIRDAARRLLDEEDRRRTDAVYWIQHYIATQCLYEEDGQFREAVFYRILWIDPGKEPDAPGDNVNTGPFKTEDAARAFIDLLPLETGLPLYRSHEGLEAVDYMTVLVDRAREEILFRETFSYLHKPLLTTSPKFIGVITPI